MNNFEKVKEMMRLENSYNRDNPFCDAVGRLRQEDYYCNMSCEECYEWLKQEYKPQILTDKEREYLSAVIKPFRDKVKGFNKGLYNSNQEYIRMTTEADVPFNIILPFFNKGKYYKNMEIDKEYALEELGL